MNAQRSLWHDTAVTVDEVMAVWSHDRNFRSRSQIAEALGRAKSPALIAVLGVLVGIGYLTIRKIDLPNGVSMFEYAASQKWLDDGGFLF